MKGAKITLLASTKVSDYPISTLSVTKKDSINEEGEILWIGNTFGEIIAVDVHQFITNDPTGKQAEKHLRLDHTLLFACFQLKLLLTSWRRHTETVTSIALIDHKELIVTSSLDCTARVWTHEGQYVGTFGQAENWDLSDDLTWSHPFIPDDVLVDPTSVPNIEKDEPEEFTRKTNPKNENESESQQWLNEVREALKTSNGKRLKIQRHLSKQPKEVAVDPASNAFRFVFKTPLLLKNIVP